MKATVLSLLSCMFGTLFTQRFRLYMFCLFPLSEPYKPPSWWLLLTSFMAVLEAQRWQKKVLSWLWDTLLSFQHFPDKDGVIILSKLVTNVLTSERKHRSPPLARNFDVSPEVHQMMCHEGTARCVRLPYKWHVIYFGQCHWLWDKNACGDEKDKGCFFWQW